MQRLATSQKLPKILIKDLRDMVKSLNRLFLVDDDRGLVKAVVHENKLKSYKEQLVEHKIIASRLFFFWLAIIQYWLVQGSGKGTTSSCNSPGKSMYILSTKDGISF